jgi:hypothetical protein
MTIGKVIEGGPAPVNGSEDAGSAAGKDRDEAELLASRAAFQKLTGQGAPWGGTISELAPADEPRGASEPPEFKYVNLSVYDLPRSTRFGHGEVTGQFICFPEPPTVRTLGDRAAALWNRVNSRDGDAPGRIDSAILPEGPLAREEVEPILVRLSHLTEKKDDLTFEESVEYETLRGKIEETLQAWARQEAELDHPMVAANGRVYGEIAAWLWGEKCRDTGERVGYVAGATAETLLAMLGTRTAVGPRAAGTPVRLPARLPGPPRPAPARPQRTVASGDGAGKPPPGSVVSNPGGPGKNERIPASPGNVTQALSNARNYGSIPPEHHWRYDRYLADPKYPNKSGPDDWWVSAQRMWANAERGNEFERQAYEALHLPLGPGSKYTIPGTPSDPTKRIPDFGPKFGVMDAKNWIEIDAGPSDSQIRRFAEYAAQHGRPFSLIISPRTQTIYAPVLDLIRKTGGKVSEFDPAAGAFTSIPLPPSGPWKRPRGGLWGGN